MARSRYLVVLLLATFIASLLNRRRRLKPSTSKLPLVGDLHKSPPDRPLLNWNAWGARHGPVATANLLFGTLVPVVLLNTVDSAAYFLSRNGGHCNNRPSSVSMELLTNVEQPGKSKFTLMHDYDDDLKRRHRILTPSLGPLAAPRYQAVMDLEVRQLLGDLVRMLQATKDSVLSRDEIHPPLERTMASTVLALHYGIRVPTTTDPILKRLLAQHHKVAGLAANPWLVDLIPALRHLPLFLSPWRRAAKAMFEDQSEFNTSLLRQARSSPSWNAARQADTVLANEMDVGRQHPARPGQPDGPVSEIELAYALATSVEGAMETVSRQALWLLVAAATHPDELQKLHGMLDAVVGQDRLPRFSDRSQLASIDAFVAETMRWRPIAAISIPRRTGEADKYDGVHVPKGVSIVANAWSIGRDTPFISAGHSVTDVEDFLPERWLQKDDMDSDISTGRRLRADLSIPVFGQGRRGCLGQRVALDALFLQAAVLLWAFDIRAADDKKIDLMSMEASGFMVLPAACNLVLRPRGDWVTKTIEAEWDRQEKDVQILLGTFRV
ncbi:cytochrome P450 [Microdochium trichocladiopsis]|uniref:Cytochrome P450 n=1 Tax=Microdochium trichocladiopsis TaxID=1682393 RepID=A0A9P8XW15_9PEZI|nr:cytochrome P450 [Microdochium trichocladiopsis]KAH7020977.1 cytochrome P450 [Microdochium trichocladiopsis]